jgi:hypothetical protein
MNEEETRNDKRMTLRQVATTTGAAYNTVCGYAQRAGWTENGKKTLLDEKQVTVILEAMKQGHAGGPNNAAGTLQTSLEGIETTQSRAVRIAILAQKQQEIERQIKAEMQAEIDELRNDSLTLDTTNLVHEIQGLQREIIALKRTIQGTANPSVYIPPPCHDLPDFRQEKKRKSILLTGIERFQGPIPIIQAFIDECCIRGIGSMNYFDIETPFLTWQQIRQVKFRIDTKRIFKYLGLMGYQTRRKNKVILVEGLSLRPGVVPEEQPKQIEKKGNAV